MLVTHDWVILLCSWHFQLFLQLAKSSFLSRERVCSPVWNTPTSSIKLCASPRLAKTCPVSALSISDKNYFLSSYQTKMLSLECAFYLLFFFFFNFLCYYCLTSVWKSLLDKPVYIPRVDGSIFIIPAHPSHTDKRLASNKLEQPREGWRTPKRPNICT